MEGTNIHPVTLVHQRLSMYDKFHERNTKQRKEILRRTKFVKQLDGVVTETAEQLNSFLSKSLYFLDCLSPVHHLIMIKFMLSIRNMNLNKKLVKNIGGANHDCDINGRILLSTKKQEGTGDDCPITSTNLHSKAGEKENENIMLAAGDKSDNSIKELFASSSQTLDEMINPWIEDLPDCHLGFQKSGNKKGDSLSKLTIDDLLGEKVGTPIEIPSIMPIDSPSIESSIEDSDSDENQTEILLNNSKNEEKMRMFLERNYSALKSIF